MAKAAYPLQIVLAGGWAQPLSAIQPLQSQLAKLGSVKMLAMDCSELELLSRVERLMHVYEGKTLAVGWSLGGLLLVRALTQKASLAREKKCAGLALVACNPCFVGDENWPGVGENVFREFEEQLLEDPAALLLRFMRLQLLGDPRFKALFRAMRQSLPVIEQKVLKQLSISLGWLKLWDCRSQLNDMERVWHFFGQEDHVNPAQLSSVVSGAFPQHQVFTICGMAHYPNTAASEEIVRKIKETLPL